MNKRARLARRVLRDHRRGKGWCNHHVTCTWRHGWVKIYDFWHCPRCAHRSALIPTRAPRAYR